MSQIVFDAYSIADIVPPKYDRQTFYYRYRNGANAQRLREFAETKARLEPLLKKSPRTMVELAQTLEIVPPLLLQILDYLFTHTAEIAALEIPARDTFYIWADAEIAEQIRSDFALGAIGFDSESIQPEDVPELAAYITNLLVLRPAVETLDATIAKTQRLCDAWRIKHSMAPTFETERNIAILEEKMRQLREHRDAEVARWGPPSSTKPPEQPGGRSGGSDGARTGAGSASGTGNGPSTSAESGPPKYLFRTLYILGSRYNYTGPEGEKRMCWRDASLRTMDFAKVTKAVIEIDTFFEDVAEGQSIGNLVESQVKPVLKSSKLEIVFRRVPGISYPRKIGKRLHQETVALLERGYRVLK